MKFSDLFSNDDEEFTQYLNRPVLHVFERSNLYESLLDDQFLKRFRLNKCSATYLLQQIAPRLVRNTDNMRRDALRERGQTVPAQPLTLTTFVTMSDIPDIEYLVQLWAQMSYYDNEIDEWIALADNNINDIVVMKRRISPHYQTGERSDVNDELLPYAPPSTPAFNYYIQGRRINDGRIFFEYMIEQDLICVEAEPCFHYWYSACKNRFGIRFQCTVHSKAFAHVVRDVLKILTDEYLKEKEARCVVEFHRNQRKLRRVHFSNYDDVCLYSQKDAMTSAKLSSILKQDSGFRQDLFREKLLQVKSIQDDIVQLEPTQKNSVQLVPIQDDPVLEKLTQMEPAKKELAPVESVQEELVQMLPDNMEKGQTEPFQEKLKTVQEKIVWIFLCAALLILFILCLELFLR